MGTLIRTWVTAPMPEGATVGGDGTVTWTVRGKKRTGKLSKTGKVSIQVDTWTAQYTDETGTVRRVSTKTTNRSVAERILAQYEAEIDRVKAGVATREGLDRSHVKKITFKGTLEQFCTKMVANGSTAGHIATTKQRILRFCHETDIDSFVKIRREVVERWIADEVKKQTLTPSSINHYLMAVKSFVKYLVDIEQLSSDPLKSIRKLNEAVGQRKNRRALTAEEVERFLQAAKIRKCRTKGKPDERLLVYRLLLGTGLRSTELSLLTPNQIDFDRNRLKIEAAKTKNKKGDVLPLRADLVQAVKKWVETHGIQPHERVFRYSRYSIHSSFCRDLKAAGIERVGSDGRSIDVHSLRKTFGTMLARAGVPLTTVQRLMRHSTPLLTAKLYIDVAPFDMMQALDKLPVFEKQD